LRDWLAGVPKITLVLIILACVFVGREKAQVIKAAQLVVRGW